MLIECPYRISCFSLIRPYYPKSSGPQPPWSMDPMNVGSRHPQVTKPRPAHRRRQASRTCQPGDAGLVEDGLIQTTSTRDCVAGFPSEPWLLGRFQGSQEVWEHEAGSLLLPWICSPKSPGARKMQVRTLRFWGCLELSGTACNGSLTTKIKETSPTCMGPRPKKNPCSPSIEAPG